MKKSSKSILRIGVPVLLIIVVITYVLMNPMVLFRFGVGVSLDIIGFEGKKTEISQILGKDEPKKYLIGLMNGAEKKPDGGFFGSYAILDIDKRGYNREIFDSYYPSTVSEEYLTLSGGYEDIFGTDRLYFLGVNNFGITSIDAQNTAQLYQRTFGEKIDGVIYINDNIANLLVEDYDSIKREQQFLNATYFSRNSGNQRNGESPKGQFMNELASMVDINFISKLLATIVNNTEQIFKNDLLRIYIFDEEDLQQSIYEFGLEKRIDSGAFTVYDFNQGFNKIDQFVTRTSTLYQDNSSFFYTTDDDIPIKDLKPGNYQLGIEYRLLIPEIYTDFIDTMSQKYQIELSEKEQIIVSQKPQWNNQTMIYLPENIDILDSRGDIYDKRQYELLGYKIIQTKALMTENGDSSNLLIEFVVQ